MSIIKSEEIMQFEKMIKSNDYKISEVKQYDGTISVVLSLKKRNCKVCAKQFQSNGTEFLLWKTKEEYSVSGWFCRKHYIEAKKLIKVCK